MKKTDTEVLHETLQRVIRTETRVMSLGNKLGFDLKDEEDIEVVVKTREAILRTLDVAFTSVIKACRRHNLHGEKVKVWFQDELVAELRV